MSETNGFATREALLGGYVPGYREVPLPDGSKVRIRNLPAGERDAYVLESRDLKTGGQRLDGLRTATARLIQLCVVDGNGNRLFSKEDIPLLQEQDPAVQDVIYAAAAKFCGLIVDEAEEKNP